MNPTTPPEHNLLTFVPRPSREPATISYGFVGWIKRHFFDGFWNTLLTIAVFSLLYLLVKPFLEWSLIKAVWVAATRRECLDISPDGACWAGVIQWFDNLIYGRYPTELRWRINLGFGLGIAWVIPLALKRVRHKVVVGIMAVALYPFLANYFFLGGDRSILHAILACTAMGYLLMVYINVVLVYTGRPQLDQHLEPYLEKVSAKNAGWLSHLTCVLMLSVLVGVGFHNLRLEHVPIDRWGGLFLTVIISGFAIVMALPIGIMLALGRRSKMPVIRWFSIAVIELVRSVPMITVLFMSVTMMPLFFPNTIDLNKLVQVIIAVCIFAGAYMAETVRGGLQSIPRGQFDAAKSVGLGYWHTMSLVILPQALKAMIPNIVTSFISMFKDTTLVSIIGLFDIMLMARNISIDKNWYGLHSEPLVAISVLFFFVCYGMSQYSQHLEKKLKTSH